MKKTFVVLMIMMFFCSSSFAVTRTVTVKEQKVFEFNVNETSNVGYIDIPLDSQWENVKINKKVVDNGTFLSTTINKKNIEVVVGGGDYKNEKMKTTKIDRIEGKNLLLDDVINKYIYLYPRYKVKDIISTSGDFKKAELYKGIIRVTVK